MRIQSKEKELNKFKKKNEKKKKIIREEKRMRRWGKTKDEIWIKKSNENKDEMNEWQKKIK